jgi:hypothetical protein
MKHHRNVLGINLFHRDHDCFCVQFVTKRDLNEPQAQLSESIKIREALQFWNFQFD